MARRRSRPGGDSASDRAGPQSRSTGREIPAGHGTLRSAARRRGPHLTETSATNRPLLRIGAGAAEATPAAVTARTRHPSGLYVLFFTELWERYSFYSMMAILTLYMDEALRFDIGLISRVYGGYLAAVYFMPLIGGLLADRLFGFNRAIVIGGVLMCAGHLALALEVLPLFYPALALLACGNGLLKPNVSTIVGNLYRDNPELRDAGYNIFYLGINLGAFAAP